MVFKKGQSGNPKGRKKMPEELKYAKKLNKEFVEVQLTKFLGKSVKDLDEILENSELPSMQHFISKIILIGIKEGDHVRLNFLFDRVIGKVTEKIEHKMPEPFIIEGFNGEKVEMGMKDKQPEE